MVSRVMAKFAKGPLWRLTITDTAVIPRLMKVVMVRVSPIDNLFTSAMKV